MIESIHGVIERKEPTNLLIKTNGFVFNLSICIREYEKLPSVGTEITILTYLNVREDLMELYGFIDKERRDLFINLISVSGIGPRTAINLLSNACDALSETPKYASDSTIIPLVIWLLTFVTNFFPKISLDNSNVSKFL